MFICASLCRSTARYATSALLLSLLLAACGGETATNGPDTGDAASIGPDRSTLSTVDSTAPDPAEVGDGAIAPSTDCKTLRYAPNCGTCVETFEDYCTLPTSCQLNAQSVCQRIWFGARWERGCGHVRVQYWGDVGDRVIDVWNESSGELVYHWFNGKLSMGCQPEMTIGAEPVCDQWADACVDAGDGGVHEAGSD